MSEIRFDVAKAADLPRLVELLGILFESEAEFSADAEKQRSALQAILSDPAKGRIYVAREGREVVAMASLLYTISTAEGVLRITLLTDMQNERAQAMYRRVGFVGSPMKPMRLKIKKGTK